MRSFLRTNYSVRLNKSIERKLIFDALSQLEDKLPLAKHHYVGLGALWFMDFILAARQLRTRSMTSYELDYEDAERARTNLPMNGIRIINGDIEQAPVELRLSTRRSIAWLDFDGYASPDLLAAVQRFASTQSVGSILIVTMQAAVKRGVVAAKREEWCRNLFGDAMPATTTKDYFDNQDLRNYPTNLCEMLMEFVTEEVRSSGSGREFVPMFSFAYRDGVAMSTVGGVVVRTKDRSGLLSSQAFKLPYVGSAVHVLDVPLLTFREKALLDAVLPARAIGVRRARRLGVRLAADQLSSYCTWFREYPLFAQVHAR